MPVSDRIRARDVPPDAARGRAHDTAHAGVRGAGLTRDTVMRMQRTIGNAAVARLLRAPNARRVLARWPPDEQKVQVRAHEIWQRRGGGHTSQAIAEANYYDAQREIEIEERAYQLWQRRGGDPVKNYYDAQKEIAGDRAAANVESMDRQSIWELLVRLTEGSLSVSESVEERIARRLEDLDVADKAAEALRSFGDRLIYIRKLKRIEDEITYVLTSRHEHYVSKHPSAKATVESGYWHAASPVLRDLPVKVYDSFKSAGVVIGPSAELGGWGKTDLTLPTKGVAKGEYPTNFPRRPMARGGKTLFTSDEVVAKLRETRARVRGERPDVSASGKPRTGFSSLFFDGQVLPGAGAEKKPYLGALEIEYSEAQIHYRPQDILGIYVEIDDDYSLEQAVTFQRRLREEFSVRVPLIRYVAGQITTYQGVEELLPAVSAADRDRHSRLADKLRSLSQG